MKNILVIEDDLSISKGISISLTEENFSTKCIDNGLEGYEEAMNGHYDLVILDIILPGMNGMEVCKKLRANDNYIPVIILTSKSEEIDKVVGLELGADDYMTKPFSIRELTARIKAVLRRSDNNNNNNGMLQIIRFGDVTINVQGQEVYKGNGKVKLSVTEFKLLLYFYNKGENVISRDELLDEVWGYDSYPSTRTVDNYILSLRKKLEDDPSEPKHFLTIPKSGYKFVN